MRKFANFLVQENAMYLGASSSQDKLVFERGQEAEEFKARVAAKICAEQNPVFLDSHKNLQYFWSKSLYAKIKIEGEVQALQLMVGYEPNELSQPRGLVYGLVVAKNSELAERYKNLPWNQFPYDLGDRENQVLLCLSAEEFQQLRVTSVLSDSELPNAAYVRQVLLGRPNGEVQGRTDDLRLFEASALAPGLQQEERPCFLDEDDVPRFVRTKVLLREKKKTLDAANRTIKELVLVAAAAALPKSTTFSSKDDRLEKFSRSVFSHYYEVVVEGKQEKVQLKAGVELDSAAIQAMGLRDNESIRQQLAIIDDIEFASSVVSATRLIELAYNIIKGQMEIELQNIPILHHDHSEGSVVCFKSSLTLHEGLVVLNNFSLSDALFARLVHDILVDTQGCFKPSDTGFAAIRHDMEQRLKGQAVRLLTARHVADKASSQVPAPLAPAQIPAEQQFRQISAATLLAAAQAAYKGKSKYRYSTLFSAPRSKFMRELVAYLTEQSQKDLGLFAIAKAMKERMEISDKCCGLFVSADDRRGVARADALEKAEKGQEITGLDDVYRTDRAIKAVLAQFGHGG